MDFKKFANMNIDLNEFTDVYNSFAKTKNNFGGGNAKIKDLLKNNGGKLKVTKTSKSKKGGNVADADARNNFFYNSKPSNSITNVNSFTDLIFKQNVTPSITSTSRGLF